MLRSMTGFGAGSADGEQGGISVEVRSLNHRYREVKARLPRELAHLEPKILALVSERIERGAVDVSVRHLDRTQSSRLIRVDASLADQLVEAMRELKMRHGLSGGVTVEALTAVEGIVEVVERPVATDELGPPVEKALCLALDGLLEMRTEEGRSLQRDFEQRLDAVAKTVTAIDAEAGGMAHAHRDRLRSRISGLLDEVAIDPGRLETEIAILADRSDVSEELTRLRSHLEQMRSLVESEEAASVGRRMGFLLQEIGREVNTIGSKSQSLAISRLVVDLKAELERMREQVQNIE